MRILVAPDKFKGSMTATEASGIIAESVSAVMPKAVIVQMPLSDGGEGLAEALCGKGQGIFMKKVVTNPVGKPVDATWGIIIKDQLAVIEMAEASGLSLLAPGERNPAKTTSYGTGELIKSALDRGCRKIVIGIGGSATNDGGCGMAEALGVQFLDKNNKKLGPVGGELINLRRIDLSGLDKRLEMTKIIVATDVDNPLTGPNGAAMVYSPQKGADSETVDLLEKGLVNYAAVIKSELGIDIDKVPGAGAAGGMGAGLCAFLDAKIKPGIELVLDELEVDSILGNTDLVITGEGSLDSQSLRGKVPVGLARRASSKGIPVIVLAGKVTGERTKLHREGITACLAIADGPLSLERSIKEGPALLRNSITELMRLVQKLYL